MQLEKAQQDVAWYKMRLEADAKANDAARALSIKQVADAKRELELCEKQKAENLVLINQLTEQRDKAELDAKAGRVSYNLCNTDLEFTRKDLKKERKNHDETKSQLVGEKAMRDTLSEVPRTLAFKSLISQAGKQEARVAAQGSRGQGSADARLPCLWCAAPHHRVPIAQDVQACHLCALSAAADGSLRQAV